jgi:DNA repair exonuclease SbcCD ATPase subunit
MKRFAFCIIVLSLLRPSVQLHAQSSRVEPKSEILLKREAADAATAAWNEKDRNLEKSILREDPMEAMKRIAAAAVKRKQVDEARQVYHELLVRDAKNQLAAFQALSEHTAVGFPRAEIERALDAQLDELMSREASLNRALTEQDPNRAPARLRLIDEQVRAQLEQLAKLRSNLYQQKQSLGSMKASEEGLSSAGKMLIDQTRDVVRVLESDADRLREEAETWDEYYSALAQLVQNRQKIRTQPRGKSTRDAAPPSITQKKAKPE